MTTLGRAISGSPSIDASSSSPTRCAAFLLASLSVLSVTNAYADAGASRTSTAPYVHCGEGPRVQCIVDGDTLWSNGIKIRIADIDAPEVFSPKCASELALGNRATDRLIELVNAGPFQIMPLGSRNEDRYGRKLRILVRNGHSLGDTLVKEGLARTWSGRREPWC